jgi:hypothetical protein
VNADNHLLVEAVSNGIKAYFYGCSFRVFLHHCIQFTVPTKCTVLNMYEYKTQLQHVTLQADHPQAAQYATFKLTADDELLLTRLNNLQ